MMRRTLKSILCGLLLCALLTGVSFAEDVYVTKSGKKYHRVDSPMIKGKSVEKMTREEAEAKGYTASRDYLKHQAEENSSAKAPVKK